MNYELAKQLKDAGIFQSGNGTRAAPPDKIVVRRDDFAYVPTLEELIEACGANFQKLFHNPITAVWSAASYKGHDVSASEPTEAVARLWLALNSQRYAGHEAHSGKI